MAKKRVKPNLGSVIAIPLPGGKYAFAKVYKDQNLGLYDFVADNIEPLSTITRHRISFFQGCTYEPIQSGKWPIVGEEPFSDEQNAWPPPRASGVFPGMPIFLETLQIEIKGALRPAKLAEVAGLDIATLAIDPESFVAELVDRLINHNHMKYRIPK
jgi:hypothetical protein